VGTAVATPVREADTLAGEYVVGAVVVRRLRWPYRIQPIADLGIDGEIEVLNDQGESTGRLVKVQSKAVWDVSSTGVPAAMYVEQRHYDYWRTLALPVVVMRPVVRSTRVFWKPAVSARATPKGVVYEFAAEDELAESSAAKLDKLSVERREQVDPLLGLLSNLMDDLAVLDYTPPDQFVLFLDTHLQTWARIHRRWKFMNELESELPELVTERVRTEMTRIKSVMDYLDRRVNIAIDQ
jgi:hypothetical protein